MLAGEYASRQDVAHLFRSLRKHIVSSASANGLSWSLAPTPDLIAGSV